MVDFITGAMVAAAIAVALYLFAHTDMIIDNGMLNKKVEIYREENVLLREENGRLCKGPEECEALLNQVERRLSESGTLKVIEHSLRYDIACIGDSLAAKEVVFKEICKELETYVDFYFSGLGSMIQPEVKGRLVLYVGDKRQCSNQY